MGLKSTLVSSRPEEFHLRALPEPCMTLSSHTAPDVRPPVEIQLPPQSPRGRCVTGATSRRFRFVEPRFDSTPAGVCVRVERGLRRIARPGLLGNRASFLYHRLSLRSAYALIIILGDFARRLRRCESTLNSSSQKLR
jgi:hypothetical protein